MKPGAPTLAFTIADMRVFRNTLFSRIVNADDDQRLDHVCTNERLDQLIETPLLIEESRRRIKQVLAVMHIQDGISGRCFLVIAGRQIHDDVATALDATGWK